MNLILTMNDKGDLVHMALIADVKPTNHNETLRIKVWKNTMKKDIVSIERNYTWELMELPFDKKSIEVHLVFKLKLNPDGSIAKHKAMLVY